MKGEESSSHDQHATAFLSDKVGGNEMWRILTENMIDRPIYGDRMRQRAIVKLGLNCMMS